MGAITLYTTESCGFCNAAKTLLKSRGLEFTEVNLSRDPEGRAELVSRTGMMTFPQILIGDKLVGGFHETKAAIENGGLDELLAA